MKEQRKTPEAKVIHASEKPKEGSRPDPKNAWTMDPNIGKD